MNTEYSESKIRTICLVVIATVVVTYLIYWLRPVLVPFVVSLFVVSGLTPLLETLETRLRVNRLVASAIAFLSGLAVLAALGVCLWLSVVQMAQKGPAYRERVSELVATVQDWLDLDSQQRDERALDSPDAEPAEEIAAAGGPLQSQVEDTAALPDTTGTPLEDFRQMLDAFLRDGLARISAELFSLVSTSVIVLIYVFFLLLGSTEVSTARGTLRDIDKQVRAYLFLKTIISMITGAAFGLALWIFGVPMSLTFGVLAFLLNYIPNVGPLVASLLPIPFILLHPEGTIVWMLAAIISTSAIQVISGNVVEPKLMGESSDLHPVVILLGLMFWGMMWGITGMFLATPMMAGLKIVLERVDSTKPMADMLAGRWKTMPLSD